MVSTVVLLAAAAAAAATSAFVAPGPVLPLRRAAAASPRRATVAGVDADAVTAAVNAALSDDVAALATELTELGTEIRRANGRTSGTASMLSAEVSGITAKGLALRCVVRKRAWASWGNKDRAEYDEDRTTLVPWPADHPAGDDGRELTLALMSLFRQAGRPLATAVLLSLPELGGDEDSGLGAAGLLPTNMWLNNVPHLSHVRTHFEDAVVRAVDESLTDPRVPPEARARQRVSLTFPELNREMDTFRIATMLELVRELATHLAVERKLRVKVSVQESMGEGIFTGLPLNLNGVFKLLNMMDWGGDDGLGDLTEGVSEKADGKPMFGNMVRVGHLGEGHVDEDGLVDDVFILVSPQNIVGHSVVPYLNDHVERAGPDRAVLLLNDDLNDIQSAEGVMGVRGRGDRIAFAESFSTIYHTQLLYPSRTAYFPIGGAITKGSFFSPWLVHQRREYSGDMVLEDSLARRYAMRAGKLQEAYVALASYDDKPTMAEVTRVFDVVERMQMKLKGAPLGAALLPGGE